MADLTFKEAIQMYRDIYCRFQKVEGKPWGAEGTVIELVKQVGELAKHVMVQEHYYFEGINKVSGYEAGKEKIANELVDIFGQVTRIADHYAIDI